MAVRQYLFDQDRVAASRYWNSDEIATGTSLTIDDVEHHLGALDEDGLADVLHGGAGSYAAIIKPAGKCLIREGPRQHTPAAAVGTIIHLLSGGNVQGVGGAVDFAMGWHSMPPTTGRISGPFRRCWGTEPSHGQALCRRGPDRQGAR